jgi:hypothetical protein
MVPHLAPLRRGTVPGCESPRTGAAFSARIRKRPAALYEIDDCNAYCGERSASADRNAQADAGWH